MSDSDSNKEFETEVLTHLIKLSTKMDMIISDDGDTGAVPRLQEDVKDVEKKIWYFSGAALGIGGFMHWIIDTWRTVKGH